MQNKETVPPIEVPETAATYERTQADNSVKGSQTSPPRTTSDQERPTPLPAGGAIKGSMKTEVPTGWDQAPQDIQDSERQRHPRPDGVGGSEHGITTRSELRASQDEHAK